MNTFETSAIIEPIPNFSDNPEVSQIQQNDTGKKKVEAAFNEIATAFKQVSEKFKNLEIENQKLRSEIANLRARSSQMLYIHHEIPLNYNHDNDQVRS